MRLAENFMAALGWAARDSRRFDYVIRVDPDIFFQRRRIASLFSSAECPTQGTIAAVIEYRRRDFIQVIADALPGGFRRRKRDGTIDRKWEFVPFRRVWWADIGRRALLNGFRRTVTPGAFIAIAGSTLREMATKGYFDRDHSDAGLVFADDALIGIMTKAVGHPIFSITDFIKDFRMNLFVTESQSLDSINAMNYDLIHPLKNTIDGNKLRAGLKFGD
jgi:hypothetical protein